MERSRWKMKCDIKRKFIVIKGAKNRIEFAAVALCI